ncbi:hypothetical protein DXH78_10710 [Undibacter mobilis]|uniref:Uncharacterized protein n=2 Tax=Undibacter mobilis TaxID=2292256 RepID=A0A371BCA5_9BRAD|nr:hypothetical protein DXH78_10710 [Undibacter mobilis]
MQDIDSLRVLLEIPLSLVRSSAGNYRHVGKFWSSVVDLDALKIKALRLSENGDASEADRRRVAEFIEALKRGKEE